MKKLIFTLGIILAAFLFTNEAKAEIRHGGDYGYFYSSLAPHGAWIELSDGVVIWRPTIIRRNWAPYTRGQWIWTSDGWYWDSYEDFGHITYHYGRWFYDDYYGWIWLPDTEWAPAWVEWRYDDDYIGWAPLSPYAIFSVNIGIHFTVDYHTPYHHWNFVRYRHFCDPYVHNYYVGPKYRYRIYNNTKYRSDYGYERDRVINRGVDVDIVRTRSGRDIRQRDIERVNDPREVRNNGRNNERVRTFVISKDQLRQDNNNVEIKRSDRKTTLETSKLEIGRRKTDDRTTRDIERVREDNNNRNNNDQIRTRDTEIKKDNNDQIRKRNTEVKRENNDKQVIPPVNRTQQERVTTEKRDNTVKTPESKIEQRKTENNQRRIEKTPERKVERRTEQKTERRVETQRTETRERKIENQSPRNNEPVRVQRENTERKTERNQTSGNNRRQR